jgi:drug/metabolite transporter (DMT)-like permease
MAAAPISRSMSGLDWALLLSLSILWGGSFFFIGVAVQELPPLTIVALRVGLAALILNGLLGMLGLRLPADRRVWVAFAGMGVLNNVGPFTLIAWGQTHIPSGLASILNATTPLFAVLVAHWFTSDERMSGNRLAGVGVGFAGVVVMIGPAALQAAGTDLLAQLAGLAAALFYAVSGVFGRRFKALGVAPMLTAAGQLSASSLILVPLALAVDQPWRLAAPSLPTWGALLGLAALSTALAFVLYFRILASAGATNVLLVTLLVPVSAILLGSLGLGERLEAKQFLGMALIAVGLVAIDGRLFRSARPQPIAAGTKPRSALRRPWRRAAHL